MGQSKPLVSLKIENKVVKVTRFRALQAFNIGIWGESEFTGENAKYKTESAGDELLIPLGNANSFGSPDRQEWEELYINAVGTIVQIDLYNGTVEDAVW